MKSSVSKNRKPLFAAFLCALFVFAVAVPAMAVGPKELPAGEYAVTARKKRGKISRKKREPEEAEGREEKQAQRAYKREAKMASLLRGW